MNIFSDRILYSKRKLLKNTQILVEAIIVVFGVTVMTLRIFSFFGGEIEFFNQNFDKLSKIFIVFGIAGAGVILFCTIKILRINQILKFCNEHRNESTKILVIKRVSWIKNTWKVVEEE